MGVKIPDFHTIWVIIRDCKKIVKVNTDIFFTTIEIKTKNKNIKIREFNFIIIRGYFRKGFFAEKTTFLALLVGNMTVCRANHFH